VWVVNGFFVFMPFVGVMGETNLPAGGWTAFVGGTLFEIGGYLMVLESLNRKHEVSPLIPSHALLTEGLFRASHRPSLFPPLPHAPSPLHNNTIP